MPNLDSLSKLPLFTNSLLDWAVALVAVAVAYVLLLAVRRVVRRYLHRLQKAETASAMLVVPLQILGRTTSLFFLIVAAFVGTQWLTMGAATAKVLDSAITIALFFQFGIWAGAAAGSWVERKRRQSVTANRAAVSSLGIVGFIANVVIWAVVGLLTLENLGVNITALVAGLGVGGIGVALAGQNVLG